MIRHGMIKKTPRAEKTCVMLCEECDCLLHLYSKYIIENK